MGYVAAFVIGVVLGAGVLLIWFFGRIADLRKEKQSLEEFSNRLKSAIQKEKESLQDWRNRLDAYSSDMTKSATDLETRKRGLDEDIASFEARKVGYDKLMTENNSVKRDLFNMAVSAKKTERDHAAITRRQAEIDGKANELAERYLDDNVSWIADKLSPKNFATCKKRLTRVVGRCRDIGFEIPERKEEKLVDDLKENFERVVRAEFERQEQARIRAQIREEERLAREIDKQIKEAERERAAIQAALERALADARDEHSAEVEHLRSKLSEAEEKAQRAKSRAEMTRAGHVYVLSNIGSFGEGVYKIGMTRRLEPKDRVKELGGASVPFLFDVHMMISCDDAPSLENALHRELHKQRVNRVNFRKEFFRIDLETIRGIVESQHGEVDYVADPEALDYRESLGMTDEDYQFVEKTVQAVWDDEDIADADE